MLRRSKIRFFIDPETGLPHVLNHGVTEEEASEALRSALEDRKGSDGSRVAIGQTESGRFLKIVYVLDEDAAFVITAMDLQGRPLLAFRRRRRK